MTYAEQVDFINDDNRGLPVTRLIKILIALRFYASGNDQVISCNMYNINNNIER